MLQVRPHLQVRIPCHAPQVSWHHCVRDQLPQSRSGALCMLRLGAYIDLPASTGGTAPCTALPLRAANCSGPCICWPWQGRCPHHGQTQGAGCRASLQWRSFRLGQSPGVPPIDGSALVQRSYTVIACWIRFQGVSELEHDNGRSATFARAAVFALPSRRPCNVHPAVCHCRDEIGEPNRAVQATAASSMSCDLAAAAHPAAARKVTVRMQALPPVSLRTAYPAELCALSVHPAAGGHTL